MNGMLQRGIKCQEMNFATKNTQSIVQQQSNMQRNQVNAPKPAPAEEEELEIDFGGKPQQSLKFNFMDKLK